MLSYYYESYLPFKHQAEGLVILCLLHYAWYSSLIIGWVGVYLNHFVHLSVCCSICVLDRVCSISPEPLNPLKILFYFYQTWYGGVLSRGDESCRKIGSLSSMSRSQWGLIESKYDYFLQYLLTISKNGITAFKDKVTVKVQNVSECLSGGYLLNHRTWTFFYQTWYGFAAS